MNSELHFNCFEPKKIGIIGCGGRARDFVMNFSRMGTNARVTSIHDLNPEAALARLAAAGEDVSGIRAWDDVDDMLDNAGLDGVIVATMWQQHVYFAKKVLARNIPLFLEKPITFSMQELIELRDAYEKSEKRAMISFPLRTSPMLALVKEIVDSGRIGTPEHIQAFNYVPYGGIYFHSKYRAAGTAGMLYEKSTHDFDWINYIADAKPTELAVMTTHKIFGGNEEPGKLCADCERQLTCLESPFMQKNFVLDDPRGIYCSFAQDVTTYDAASALIMYESGLHASYAENHFARKSAGARGGRISGYSGTIDFDWFKNTVTVARHHNSVTETHEFDSSMGHFGGDTILAYDFVRMMHGENDSIASLENGFISNLMAMAAHKSLDEKTFAPVIWGDGVKI